MRTIAYILYLITVTSVGAEVILRYVHTPPAVLLRIESNRLARNLEQTQRQNWDSDNLRFVPKSKGRIIHSEYNVAASHDPLGYRNPCYDFSAPTTGLLVGDSFVYGIGVEDELTFGCTLKRLRPDTNIYTIGFPGAGPKRYVEMLQRNKSNLEKLPGVPGSSLSVLFFTGNDFENMLHLNSSQSTSTSQTANADSTVRKLVNWINRAFVVNPILSESYFLQALKIAALRVGRLKERGDYFEDHGGSSFYKKAGPIKVGPHSNALRVFREKVQSMGYKMGVIYLLPDPAEVSTARLERVAKIAQFRPTDVDIDYKFRVMRASCAENGITCVDLRPWLSGDHYYLHDNHLKPEGVRRASQRILSVQE